MHANAPRFNSATHPRHAARVANPAVPTSACGIPAICSFLCFFAQQRWQTPRKSASQKPSADKVTADEKILARPLDTVARIRIIQFELILMNLQAISAVELRTVYSDA